MNKAAYRPENRGFDELFIHGSGGIGQAGDAPGNHNINPTLWHNDHFEETEGYCMDLYFDRATEWIDEKRKGDQPFFAYIATRALAPETERRSRRPAQLCRSRWVRRQDTVALRVDSAGTIARRQ